MLTGDTVEIVDVDIDVVAVVLPAITVTMTAIWQSGFTKPMSTAA